MSRNALHSRAREERKTPDPGLKEWPAPIVVQLGAYRKVVINTPAEALSFLVNRWPGRQTDAYRTARFLGSEFLRRRASSDQVREAFELAVASEGLLG